MDELSPQKRREARGESFFHSLQEERGVVKDGREQEAHRWSPVSLFYRISGLAHGRSLYGVAVEVLCRRQGDESLAGGRGGSSGSLGSREKAGSADSAGVFHGAELFL